MSLFKILPWFSYQCPDNEENYSTMSMICARLNSGSELEDNIIVSSHSGFISILQPNAREGATQSGESFEAAPNHSSIVYEAKLTEPILGILSGNFLSYSQRQEHKSNNIAVLHPRKLVIYSLVKSSTPHNEHGQQAKLQMLLQHDLPKSAFSFCKGHFGGVKSKEYICVMFLDGSLKFFEQDSISHNCSLPGTRTILTNMIYVARTDCFVMMSPNWDLECYRYLSLSESFERKFSPIWSVCVGEYILDLNSHQISNTESLIVLLGENNLICISDTGKTRFIKKLDYTPLSFCSFVIGWHFGLEFTVRLIRLNNLSSESLPTEPGCKLMIAVATENGSLLIYNESTLFWCAELIDVKTISFQRGNFGGLAGGLVTLTSTGKVTIGYLGSNPSIYKVPALNLTKLDYYKSKNELEEMETEINSSVDNTDVQFINTSAEKDVQIRDVRLESESIGDEAIFKLDIEIVITIKLEQLQLIVEASNAAWIVPEPVHFFKDPKPHESIYLRSLVRCHESNDQQDYENFSDEIILLVSFINKQGITRAFKRVVVIEPKLLLERSAPQKEGSFKVTLSLSGVLDIKLMLADLNIETIEQAIGLQPLNTQHNITLISSKDSNRYRLQSNNMAALTLALSILTKYVVQSNDNKPSKSGTAIPSATIELFLLSIEKYHKLKQEMKTVIDALGTRTIEMRLFERCFLAKMQEKSSAHATAGIELLLRESFNEISSLINKLKDLKLRITRLKNQISSMIYFMRKIEQVNQKNQELLNIMRTLTDFQVISWVEAVAPAVDFIFNAKQLKKNRNQPYQNFSANEKFSFSKLSKQLKNILSDIDEPGAEKGLIEESETEKFENDWSAQTPQILEEK